MLEVFLAVGALFLTTLVLFEKPPSSIFNCQNRCQKAMKYYIYISDAKVDLLFPQVPRDIRKRVALEFKMDLKLLSALRETETGGGDNRIARLEAVLRFIRERGNIGTVDRPDEYFEGSLPMKWSDCFVDRTFLAYFGAETKQTIVGLGASVRHLIGNSEGAVVPMSPSTPAVIRFLSNYLNMEKCDSTPRSVVTVAEELKYSTRLALRSIKGPNQELEFLAKRLAYWAADPEWRRKSNLSSVLVGTPLYVAMADNRSSGLNGRKS